MQIYLIIFFTQCKERDIIFSKTDKEKKFRMKTTGIITEYNPFHNGHDYHLKQAYEISGADRVIAVMSGDFCQRGTPALWNKYLRATCAVHCGVHAVLELPVFYATASAEYFARGALLSLANTGIVDSICFGAETDDIALLEQVADYLCNNAEEMRSSIAPFLKEGMTYPAARTKALLQKLNTPALSDLLTKPNNILAIEYLKAIKKYQLPFKYHVIKRIENDYHDTKLNTHISSATAIRSQILEHAFSNDDRLRKKIEDNLPTSTLSHISSHFNNIIIPNDITPYILYALWQHASYEDYADISSDFSDRIRHLDDATMSFDEICLALKTKQLTHTRISRCLLHILLRITKSDFEKSIENDYIHYHRLLALHTDGNDVIKGIKNNSDIPLIDKVAPAMKQLNGIAKTSLQYDINSAHLYNAIYGAKYKIALKNEYVGGISYERRK